MVKCRDILRMKLDGMWLLAGEGGIVWCHGFRRKNETRQHDMVLYLIEEMQNKELVIV